MDKNREIANRLTETYVGIPVESFKSDEDKSPGAIDYIMSLIKGVGHGLPFSGAAENVGEYIGEKITGQKPAKAFEVVPGMETIGEAASTIPAFLAGTAGLAGSRLPGIAARGILPQMARGAISNLAAQEMRSPELSGKKALIDLGAGAAGELAGVAAKGVGVGMKWGAEKLWKTILKRPAGELSKEVLQVAARNIKPQSIEKEIVERGYAPVSLGGLVKKATKAAQGAMPKRDAIIKGIKEQPRPETITKYLKQEIEELKPGWGENAPIVPGTEAAVGKHQKLLSATEKWLNQFGAAEDVEKLKEIHQHMASKVYGKAPMSATERVALQGSRALGRGARESLEEAAGKQGEALAALNREYGVNKEIAEAASLAAARTGKGVGLAPLTLGALGLGGHAAEEKYGHGGEATLPLLLMAGLASPAARLLTAGLLSQSARAMPGAMRSLAPVISGVID